MELLPNKPNLYLLNDSLVIEAKFSKLILELAEIQKQTENMDPQLLLLLPSNGQGIDLHVSLAF